jgi:hypothetical protein
MRAMTPFFLWIEQSGLSVWVRESPSIMAFPFILYLHTLGLALLAGLSVALDFWLLAGATRAPRIATRGYFQVMWLGFGINAVSGVVLLIAYPAKALTNWVFYTKMLLIVLALWALEATRREVFQDVRPGDTIAVTQRARLLAVASLALWVGTIFAGRLLAYTHTILMASDPPVGPL